MRMRDSQRSKVYKSERVLEEFKGKNYTSTDEVKSRIEQILASPWTKKHFRFYSMNVTVRPGKGSRRATFSGSSTFTMPKWARTERVILHEMAHMLDDARIDDFKKIGAEWAWTRRRVPPSASHGWKFCKTFLDLVRFWMGKDAYEALRKSFKENKVKYTEPRKRKALTEVQKEALRLRMAAARSARTLKVAASNEGPRELQRLLTF